MLDPLRQKRRIGLDKRSERRPRQIHVTMSSGLGDALDLSLRIGDTRNRIANLHSARVTIDYSLYLYFAVHSTVNGYLLA